MKTSAASDRVNWILEIVWFTMKGLNVVLLFVLLLIIVYYSLEPATHWLITNKKDEKLKTE